MNALLLVLILGSTAPREAQALFEIGGVVTDETGGLIAGASVTLKDERGGVQPATSTNKEGRYRLVAATPGTATLTVSKAGFAPESRTVKVASAGSATIDVRLRVAITERVDVRSGLTRASLASDQNLSGIRLTDKISRRFLTTLTACCRRFDCSRQRPARAWTWSRFMSMACRSRGGCHPRTSSRACGSMRIRSRPSSASRERAGSKS